ncbi:MAG: ATP-binding protein [Dehalococcoidia bacterium]|nr:ATP-binding protein [Dehalococcoidia bacterium]
MVLPPGQPLDARQVASLFHPPADVAHIPGLRVAPALRTEAPPSRPGLFLGAGVGRSGQSSDLQITPEDLTRHALVVGPSGSGKTTWLAHLARELTRVGAGITVIDPHGGLVEELAVTLPREATARSALVRARDPDYVLGLNPLVGSTSDRARVADELIDMLQRAFGRSHWGPMLELTLRHAFIAAAEIGGSVRESARLLEDPDYRELTIGTLRSASTTRFFEALEDASIFDRRVLPAVHRLERLLATPTLASALGSPQRTLDFEKVMHNRETLLLDLSGIGLAPARLLGGLLLLLLRNATFARPRNPSTHVVIVDEASWFLSPTVAELLDGARKFGVGLVLAVQRLAQLEPETLRNAVLANTANSFAFRILDHDDARILARLFSDSRIGPDELQRLGQYEAYARLTMRGETHPVAWMQAPAPSPAALPEQKIERLLAHGRTRHMRSRRERDESEPLSTDTDEPEIITVYDEPVPADAA